MRSKRLSILFLPLFIGAGAVFFLFFTTPGAIWLTRGILYLAFDSSAVTFGSLKGSIGTGVSVRDIQVSRLTGLPAGSVLKVQELIVSGNPLHLEHMKAEVRNGRLHLPESDHPVFFAGRYEDFIFNINLFSKSVGVRDTLELFSKEGNFSRVAGVVSDLDGYIKGSWRRPEVSGTLKIENFSYKEFLLEDCPVSFRLQIEGVKTNPAGTGEVVFQSGRIRSKRAVVSLEESRMLFSGNLKEPDLRFSGVSRIEDIKINIQLLGTLKKPELRLSSDPPLAQESLLLMLVTGKKWGGVDSAVSSGQVPLNLARDFVDYFIFSNMGEHLSKKLGMEGVSLTYNTQTNEMGVTKSVADKMELRYGVERPRAGEQPKTTETHKVGAEIKITDKISVEAQGQVRQPTEEEESQQETAQKDGKVLLKYKQKF
ncbi:MAG: translocation/assembly module TamB [Candidatus Omnitrophica bacterium]|nr:translocation/assembly module TamB [Candidatus Omnitrophota bacterium]